MKFIFTILLLLHSNIVLAENSALDEISEVLIVNHIVSRDSGQKVTKEFLSSCIRVLSSKRYKLECDDVLFTHYISYFDYIGENSTIILITEDGASVENRWVFQMQDGQYVDVKNQVWPHITASMISKLLIQQTENRKYTVDFITSVAHSSYRLDYTMNNIMKVRSGIPDESYGTELGEITWDGHKFNFTPKSS